MRHRFIASLLIIMLLAVGCVGGGSRATAPSPSAQINARLNALEKAWERKDPTAFANQFGYPAIIGADRSVPSAKEMRDIASGSFAELREIRSVKYTDREILFDDHGAAFVGAILVIDATVSDGESGVFEDLVVLKAMKANNWKFTHYAVLVP